MIKHKRKEEKTVERENLFMIDMDKDDMVIDREEFILRRESAHVRAERQELNEKLSKSILRSVFGVDILMTLFSVILFMIGLCCAATTLFEYLKTKVFSAFSLCLVLILFALSGVFYVLKRVFDKKNEKKKPINAIDDELGRLNEISAQELRVPNDAKTVEIFGHLYREGDSLDEPYYVDEVTVFEEDGTLCLQYIGIVIGIPIESVEAVVRLENTITFSDWIKDSPYDGGEYLQYGIVKRQVNEYDEEYSMNGYYSIRFSKEGIPFELLVPLYEIEPFLDILKLEITEI